jgi:hypothetical protein
MHCYKGMLQYTVKRRPEPVHSVETRRMTVEGKNCNLPYPSQFIICE